MWYISTLKGGVYYIENLLMFLGTKDWRRGQ